MQASPLTFQEPVSACDVLSRFELFRTRDRDEAREWGKRVFCDNTLEYRSHTNSDAYMYYRQAGNVGLGRLSYGSEVVISPVDLESFILFQIPVTGSETITQKGSQILTDSCHGCFINASEPARVHHQSGTEKLIVRINRESLENACQHYLGKMLPAAIEFEPEMSTGTADSQRWLRTLSWAYDMLSVPCTLSSPLLEKQIEQSIISLLLECQPHNYTDLLRQDSPKISPAFVRRAKEFIEANIHNAITIDDVASAAGVSTRSLYNGFRTYSSTTPNQFIKDLRLNKAHSMLADSDATTTSVTEVAVLCGFNHLGHFTCDYKKRFGESPSLTLMK